MGDFVPDETVIIDDRSYDLPDGLHAHVNIPSEQHGHNLPGDVTPGNIRSAFADKNADANKNDLKNSHAADRTSSDSILEPTQSLADHVIVSGDIEELVSGKSITIDGDSYPLHEAANIEPGVSSGSNVEAIVDNAGIVTSVTTLDPVEPSIAPPASDELTVPIVTPATPTTNGTAAESSKTPTDTQLPAPPASPPTPPTTGDTDPDSEPDDEAEMSLLEHLEEMRERLIKSSIALFVSTIASLVFAKPVLEAFTSLLPEGAGVISLKPTETYVVYFKVALVLGLAIAMPIIVYQFFAFVMPGLTRQEKRWLYIVAPGAGILFVVGLLFAYLVILPFGIPILQAFLSDLVTPEWRLDYYVTFVLRFLIISGLIFQTPLVIFFLSKLGIISQERLSSSRRYAVVIAAATAALLTPTTDPFTMLLVMGPMLLLYEVGILLARFF